MSLFTLIISKRERGEGGGGGGGRGGDRVSKTHNIAAAILCEIRLAKTYTGKYTLSTADMSACEKIKLEIKILTTILGNSQELLLAGRRQDLDDAADSGARRTLELPATPTNNY
jgi:hypothetical protein